MTIIRTVPVVVPLCSTEYLNRISGLLLDRIDLHVELTPVGFNELLSNEAGETSAIIRDRVIRAREKQYCRFSEQAGIYANAQMDSSLLKKICIIGKAGSMLLKAAIEKTESFREGL